MSGQRRNQAVRRDGAPALRPGGGRRAAWLFLALVATGGALAPARAWWHPARIEPRVDNMDELLCGCEERRARALERNTELDTWVAFKASQGEDVRAQVTRSPVPECSTEPLRQGIAAKSPGVWAIASAGGTRLFATVNLPFPALLVSSDDGNSWHYRHVFLSGWNVDKPTLLRGLDYRDGLLAVASETGVLLSRDEGRSFTAALPDKPFSAVAISPRSRQRLVAGGNATSYLSEDGGATWADLAFSRFTGSLPTRNPYLVDHITSLRFDPLADTVYVGTGSHLYRLTLGTRPGSVLQAIAGRWQAMEGPQGAKVLDDSTVYNIEIGSRMMISTCNGVYYLERLGANADTPQADVRWGKFRDAAFANRGVGGPRGNLRAYYVAEDPDERGRVVIADFAGLYEGRDEGGRMRWRRVEELPYYSAGRGYPEYTSIAWTGDGDMVVGSRYRGIFVEEPDTPRRLAGRPASAGDGVLGSRGCTLK